MVTRLINESHICTFAIIGRHTPNLSPFLECVSALLEAAVAWSMQLLFVCHWSRSQLESLDSLSSSSEIAVHSEERVHEL